MKKVVLFFAICSLILCSINSVEAGITIDRVWTDEYGYAYALVTYTNDTEKTFGTVTIQCVALDNADKKININSRSFYAHEYGPIHPGFTGTLKIHVELYGCDMKSMSCVCRQR